MDISLGKNWETAGSRIEFDEEEEDEDRRERAVAAERQSHQAREGDSPPDPPPPPRESSPDRKRRRRAQESPTPRDRAATPIQKLRAELLRTISDDVRDVSCSPETESSGGGGGRRVEDVAGDDEVADWVSMPFVNIDREGKMFVAREAVDMLTGHRRPLAVVCITGPARSGKSSAINTVIGGRTPRELRNPRCGARVGDTTNPCTEGVHFMPIQSAEKLWRRLGVATPPPSPSSSSSSSAEEEEGSGGFDVLILDSEGTEALNRQAQYNTNLLTLLFLISSTFVYNTKGSIDEAALEKLTTVVQAARRVMSKNEGAEAGGGFSLPAFLWLVRDFMLVLADEGGRPISSDQYLDSALRVTPGMTKDRAMLRRDFARFFRSRGCCTMAIPHSDPKVLQQVSTADPSILTPEFRRDVERVRGVLPLAVRPRVMCGTTAVTGEGLLHVLRIFVAALNKGEVPEVKSSWMQVAEARCQDIVDEGVDRLREEVQKSQERDLLDSVAALRSVRDATVAKVREQGLDSIAPRKMFDILDAAAAVSRSRVVEAWMQRVSSGLPHPPPVENLGLGLGLEGGGVEEVEQDAEKVREGLGRWLESYRRLIRAAVPVSVSVSGGSGTGTGPEPSHPGSDAASDLLADAVLGRCLAESLPRILSRAWEEGELASARRGGGASQQELEETRQELERCRDEMAKARAAAAADREGLAAELENSRRETRKAASEKDRQAENLSRLESELEVMSELQARASIMEEETQRLRRDAQASEERAERELGALQEALAAAAAESAESKRAFEAFRRRAREETEAAAALREKLTREMEIYRAESTTKIAMLSSERDRYREETERARQALIAEKRRSESAAENARAELRKERDAAKDLSDRLHESDMRVARAEMAAQKLAITLEELQRKDEEIADLKDDGAKLREKVSRLTGENRAQKDARERLAEELRSAKEEVASLRAESRNRVR